jgi:hypothetical protein
MIKNTWPDGRYCMLFFGAILFAFSAVWEEQCLRGGDSRTTDGCIWLLGTL